MQRALAGFCAMMPLGVAWISAAAPPDKQLAAFTGLFVCVMLGIISGSAIGAVVGSVKTDIILDDSGWFGAVMVSAVLVLVVLFVILFGTAAPTELAKGEEPAKPEGVRNAVMNIEFFACTIIGFLGASEGGVIMVLMQVHKISGGRSSDLTGLF